MEVCIKIEPVPGEAPKMFGRHFDETDMLVSKVCSNAIMPMYCSCLQIMLKLLVIIISDK